MADDSQEKILHYVGEEILASLGAVAHAAQRALSNDTFDTPTINLANPTNTMVGEDKAQRKYRELHSDVGAALRRLVREPFVARVEVQWDADGGKPVQTFYFSRPSAAYISPEIGGRILGTLGTLAAPLGRLAEFEAGEDVDLEIRGQEKHARILRRTVLLPEQQNGIWDALVRRFETTPWGDILELLRHESLRQAMDELTRDSAGPLPLEDIVGHLFQEAADDALERQRIRRKVVDRIALRDQPILDKFQGEIFRLPLDRQVVLFGPPGSGKTTTLIKRLAQKRTPDALTENEEKILSGYVRDNFARADSWAMFSPAELLKQYLSDAFNQEGVPDAGNVRTWENERHDLARNVLNILRSSSAGRFQLEANPNLLIDPSSRGISNLHDEFAPYFETNLLKRCNDAQTGLLTTTDEKVKREALSLQRTLDSSKGFGIRDILRLFDQADGLQNEIRRLSDQIATELNKIANLLLNTHKRLLDDIISALPAIRAEEEEEADDDSDEVAQAAVVSTNTRVEALNILMSALRNWARAIAEGRGPLGGQSGRVIEFLKAKLPPDDRFASVGAGIVTRSRLRVLVQAPRASVLGVPAMYARFRRQLVREGLHFIANDATATFVNRNRISHDEVDILMLVMLRNARLIVEYPDGRRLEHASQHDWFENIKSRYLMQVFVDEATDLSAVQLACTVELANPKLRSWFACGDLRQRITANGIQNDSEIAWVNHTTGIRVDTRKIDIGYRQSRRLRDLSDALGTLLDGNSKAITNAPRGSEEADVWPLLGEHLAGTALAKWLADRIHEVERAIGKLPSIAVFVDGDDLIDPLVSATRGFLAERNISIVGCKEGRVVGDAREVRVFDVQHIKGLEFEAVFFVGIDDLASRIPALFQRFFYVGVTRAATYLALSCQHALPAQLETLRSKFRTDGWAEV